MIVLRIYQSEPDWSALVRLDSGANITLTFPEMPLEADVLAAAAAYNVPPETVIEVEAEDGQVIDRV